jgi:hypothetical protein
MTIKMFLVLILGFGPHVLTSNNGNLEIRQHQGVLIEQGFSKIDYQQSYGIIPRSVDSLFAIQQEKKEAPIFAGANNPVDTIDTIARLRQKEKPAGFVIRRIMTYPVVSEDNKISS